MSRANVELLRRYLDGWEIGDTSFIAALYHPEVEFIPLRVGTEGAYHGLDGMERFVADTVEAFDKFEAQFEYSDQGERVLAWGTLHVRGRGSGLETEVETGGIFDFRDGKVVRWQDFGSKAAAVAAAGLPDQEADAGR